MSPTLKAQVRRAQLANLAIALALVASTIALILSIFYAVVVTDRIDATNHETCLQRRANVVASNKGTLFVLRKFLGSAVQAREASAVALRAGPQSASAIEQARLNDDAAASYRALLARLPTKYIVPTC